jgi:dihydroflavonol-4-reductase
MRYHSAMDPPATSQPAPAMDPLVTSSSSSSPPAPAMDPLVTSSSSLPAPAPLVLVTGASGYIAGHVIQQLLAAGFRVRGTVRSLKAADKVAHLARLVPPGGRPVELCEADLSSDDGWAAAVDGCDYVLHVASPFPLVEPADVSVLVKPAVEGTLRVLRAVADAPAGRRPRRVVLTSSIAAIVYGHLPSAQSGGRVFDGSDWSELERPLRPVGAYPRSKTLAERAAWDFRGSLPPERRFELVALNPGFVMGPVLSPVPSSSGDIIRMMLTRAYPGCPPIVFDGVDVRDVARAHIRAMLAPAAAVDGQRIPCVAFAAPFVEIARTLDAAMRRHGYRVPTTPLPAWLLRLAGLFDATARLAADNSNISYTVSTAAARERLGMTAWRDMAASAVPMALSMIASGQVPDASPGRTLSRAPYVVAVDDVADIRPPLPLPPAAPVTAAEATAPPDAAAAAT